MTRSRSELNEILDSLRNWETAPPRARRFHDVRRELESQVRVSLASWWPWVGDEVLARYRDRVRRLSDVAESLVTLVADAERLESEVRVLEDSLTPADAELSAWMRGLCRDWIATLGRLGVTCDRTADLFAEQNVLATTEKAVRLHDEVLRELRAADEIVAKIGSVRTVALSGRLPEFRKRLYDKGAHLSWLAEFRALVEPLAAFAGRVDTPPPEVASLTHALREARGWSRQLDGEGAQELQALTARDITHGDFEPEPAELQTLLAQANALCARLIARANELRAERLAALRLQMTDLRRACGPQTELDLELAELEAQPYDHPQLFREWMNDADAFVEHFHAIAQTHHGEIDRRLDEARERVEKMLDALDARPLSNEVRKNVTLLRRDLGQMPRDSGTRDMLQQLRRMAEAEQEVAALAARAEAELVEIDQRQRQLTVRNEALQTEIARVKRLKIETHDLSDRIAALSDESVQVSLEERRRQIDELSGELDTVEAAFIDGCRRVLAERVAAIERIIRALRTAGVTDASAPSPAIDAATGLRDATEAVLAARGQHDALMQRAHEIATELELQRQQAQDDLSALRSDDLGPADRELAAALMQEHEPEGLPESRALLERIEWIAAVRDKCAMFFERLRMEEQSARERHAVLLARLRSFNDEQLRRFCPELADRVTALIYGIPAHPRHWAAVHHQLDVAGELFDRVETQARRLAAEELEEATAVLRQRLGGSSGASFRTTAQALLDEVEVRKNESLAPVTLRLRVLGAANAAGGKR
ncbi:MAG: hypothetical protein M3Q69_05075 [Acidobacteriota bacterium]|nr:hypothetical protein [Acidobacteriota bacterium]